MELYKQLQCRDNARCGTASCVRSNVNACTKNSGVLEQNERLPQVLIEVLSCLRKGQRSPPRSQAQRIVFYCVMQEGETSDQFFR